MTDIDHRACMVQGVIGDGKPFANHRNDGHTEHHLVCVDDDEGEESVEKEKVSHRHASLSFGVRRIDFVAGLEVSHLERLRMLAEYKSKGDRLR